MTHNASDNAKVLPLCEHVSVVNDKGLLQPHSSTRGNSWEAQWIRFLILTCPEQKDDSQPSVTATK